MEFHQLLWHIETIYIRRLEASAPEADHHPPISVYIRSVLNMYWGVLGISLLFTALGAEGRGSRDGRAAGPTLTVKVNTTLTSYGWGERAVTLTVFYNGTQVADRIVADAGSMKSIDLNPVDADEHVKYSARLWEVDDVKPNTNLTSQAVLSAIRSSSRGSSFPITVTAYARDRNTGRLGVLKRVETMVRWESVSYRQTNSHKFRQPRTISVAALPDAEGERDRLRQAHLWADFMPTGFYLNPGNAVHVKVNKRSPERGPMLDILVGTPGLIDPLRPEETLPLQLESHPFGKDQDEISVTSKEGGIMYIRYTHGAGEKPPRAIKVTIEGEAAQPFPFFREEITTIEEWEEMLKETTVPFAELSGERIILTGLAESARAAAEDPSHDQQALLRTYKDIVEAQDAISGLHSTGWIINPRDMPSPLRPMVVHGKWDYLARASAQDYRVALSKYWAHEMWSSAYLVRSWTIWHELGRQRQHVDTWSWGAVKNISADIYALATRRVLPEIPEHERKHGTADEWRSAQEYLTSRRRVFDIEDDVVVDPYTYEPLPVRLVMFEQLREVFGNEFYHRLHKRSRRARVQASDADKKHWFMCEASDLAQQDLTEFFVKWGLDPEWRTVREMGNYPKPREDFTRRAVYQKRVGADRVDG